MRHTSSLLALAAALFVSAPAAAQVGDFRLPPAPTPTPTPNVQGPVDPTIPSRPAPTPTATPRPSPTPVPTATSPAPSPTARPTSAPAPTATRTTQPRPGTSPQVPAPTLPTQTAPPRAQSGPATGTPSDLQPAPSPGALPDFSVPDGSGAADPANPNAELVEEGGSNWWKWLLGGLLLGAAGTGAFLLLRQRRGMAGPAAVPEIVRPVVRPRPQPADPPGDVPAAAKPADNVTAATPKVSAGPLEIEIVPRSLSLTLVAATLAYRIRIGNTSGADLEGVAVEADLTSAHAAQPQSEQLADRDTVLQTRHRLDTLAAGEMKELSGELRLPLTEVTAATAKAIDGHLSDLGLL